MSFINACRAVIRGVRRYGRIIQKSALDLTDLKHRDMAQRSLALLQEHLQELQPHAEPMAMRARYRREGKKAWSTAAVSVLQRARYLVLDFNKLAQVLVE